MVPYFLLISLPILAWSMSARYRITIDQKILYQTRSACIDVFMLQLLILLALRGLECGVDTKQYLRLFKKYTKASISNLLAEGEREWGFKLLNKLIGMFGCDFQILLIITALVCVCPLWYFYKRESEDQLLTISLFLSVAPFSMYFSGVRQAMAMSVGVLAWYCARNQRPVKFLVSVFLAMQLHTSAFLLLLIYPLYFARITQKWLWVVVPCIIAVYIFKAPIFDVMVTFLWEEYDSSPETGATTMLILLILFSIFAYLIPDEEQMDQDTVALRNMLLLSVTLQIFAMLHPLSMRMNYYFLIFVPVLLPKLITRSKKQFAHVANFTNLIMTGYFFYHFAAKVIQNVDPLHMFPYIPFWRN